MPDDAVNKKPRKPSTRSCIFRERLRLMTFGSGADTRDLRRIVRRRVLRVFAYTKTLAKSRTTLLLSTGYELTDMDDVGHTTWTRTEDS